MILTNNLLYFITFSLFIFNNSSCNKDNNNCFDKSLVSDFIITKIDTIEVGNPPPPLATIQFDCTGQLNSGNPCRVNVFGTSLGISGQEQQCKFIYIFVKELESQWFRQKIAATQDISGDWTINIQLGDEFQNNPIGDEFEIVGVVTGYDLSADSASVPDLNTYLPSDHIRTNSVILEIN